MRATFRSAARWLNDNALLACLLVLYVLPVWAFQYFPSADGPMHLYNAMLIGELADPSEDFFRQYFLLSDKPDPTWFVHLLLAGLMQLFPPLVAEKILVSLCIVLLPLSAAYALRAIDKDSQFLALLAVPFSLSFLLHSGFYGFVLSLAMFFFVLGYWFRHADGFTPKSLTVLSVLGLLLYLTHIVSFVMTGVAIALLTLCASVRDLKTGDTFYEVAKNRAAKPLLAFLPAFVLAALFLGSRETSFYSDGANYLLRLAYLAGVGSLISFQLSEGFFTVALASLFAVASFHALREKIVRKAFNRGDLLLIVFVAYFLLYLLTPQIIVASPGTADGLSTGGGLYIRERLGVFPFFALLLWLGAQAYTPKFRNGLFIGAVALSCGWLTLHSVKYKEINDQLAELVSAEKLIMLESTVLSLYTAKLGYRPNNPNVSGPLSVPFIDRIAKRLPQIFAEDKMVLRADPFAHAIHYIALKKRLVSLNNVQSAFGYYPILNRPEIDPRITIGELDAEKPQRSNSSPTPRELAQRSIMSSYGWDERKTRITSTHAPFTINLLKASNSSTSHPTILWSCSETKRILRTTS